jgi:hypothetical protein
MVVHSIIITNFSGVLLLSRYYAGGCEAWDGEGAACRAAWERRVWGLAAPWSGNSRPEGEGILDQWTVVWRTQGEFAIFLAGDDE